MCVLHFLYLFICWWTLKLLPFPGIVNNMALSIGVHVYFLISVFFFPKYIPRSGIAESSGSYIFRFWEASTLSSTVATSVYLLTSRVPGFSLLHSLSRSSYLSSFCWPPFWQVWGDTVVLICTSLMINDVGRVFICLLPICMSSLGKCLFSSFAHFSVFFFFGCCVTCGVLVSWPGVEPGSPPYSGNMESQPLDPQGI